MGYIDPKNILKHFQTPSKNLPRQPQVSSKYPQNIPKKYYIGFLIITRSLTMEIERNLVQMIRTGPPEVLGRFGQVLGRFWVGFSI